MIPVAILCGGLGTRLGPLTANLPKPMVDVGGRPYLERVIESFRSSGFRDIVLLTGHRAEVIEQHFGDGAAFGVRIVYSREHEPLGTGGALLLARQHLGQRFLMTFGDVLRRYDYDGFVRKHPGNCLAVYPRVDIGNAEIEAVKGSMVVTRFDKGAPELPWLDAGFSVIETRHLDLIPATGAASFEALVYPFLAGRRELEAEVVDLDFCDIGTPEELARTCARLGSS